MGKSSTAGKFALGAAVAAAAGYVAGILTAPKAGRETRADIKSVAHKSVDELEKQLHGIQDELKQLLADAKAQGSKLSDKAKEEIEVAANKANVAKDKSTEVLKAVRKGAAADEDLQKSVDEAKAALEHLRAYLTK